MKPNPTLTKPRRHRRNGRRLAWIPILMLSPAQARAALFKGEALDQVANVLTWVVLVVAPIVAIGIFLVIHILPEKIAERRQHPQTKAIQCLCLLSLFFGGILWPLAWLWAYTRPVMYRLAYGTEKAEHGPGGTPAREVQDEEELQHLRQRVAELEARQARKSAEGGKA